MQAGTAIALVLTNVLLSIKIINLDQFYYQLERLQWVSTSHQLYRESSH